MFATGGDESFVPRRRPNGAIYMSGSLGQITRNDEANTVSSQTVDVAAAALHRVQSRPQSHTRCSWYRVLLLMVPYSGELKLRSARRLKFRDRCCIVTVAELCIPSHGHLFGCRQVFYKRRTSVQSAGSARMRGSW